MSAVYGSCIGVLIESNKSITIMLTPTESIISSSLEPVIKGHIANM